jgi:hypothetical protein
MWLIERIEEAKVAPHISGRDYRLASGFVPVPLGERRAYVLRVWTGQPELAHDAVDRTPERAFQVFAYVHLNRPICLAVIRRFGAPHECPQDALMHFFGCVSAQGLVVCAAHKDKDAVRTYAVDDSVWPTKGPVEHKKADWRVHGLTGTPQVVTVLAEVAISVVSLQ